ncbi:hypothetical protein A2T82_19905 [Burkholderia cenocepacia]|nr:hypothetical protein A2T82_19905 [Burkholderia cenocepacia]MBR8117471.1 hypothetical protein [Burkholderia cenocepacia]
MMTATKKRKTEKRHVKHASTTGTDQKSLVKAVVQNDSGEWVRPSTGDKFVIDETPKFPEITFEIKTEQPPPYQWKWTITWDAQVSGLREKPRGKKLKTFSDTGSFSINDKTWVADPGGKILGGKLVVEVTAGTEQFRRTVFIVGTNPSKGAVLEFLKTQKDAVGFDRVINQESHFKNFINADNEPVVAFDNGYGMTQMTNPAPTYEQVWNWKENIKVGIKLYQEKQGYAKNDLAGHPYTEDQLIRATFSRWNGSVYYRWDESSKAWVPNGTIMCDPDTSNIGWDMSKDANKGKTVEELHKRDKDTYKSGKAGRSDEHAWIYSGICYADHMANN